jgi:S-adenosylmethionine uptake transporter
MEQNNSPIAVTWFIMSLIISLFNDTITKVLNSNLNPTALAFWRFSFSTLILTPFIIKGGLQSIKTSKLPLHVIRGLILALALYLWCYGLSFIPIATVTLMSFTIPLFTLILASLFLREKLSLKHYAASFLGFLGIILTLVPQGITFPLSSLIFLAASILFATLDILNKKLLNQGEKTLPMLFYSNLFSATTLGFVGYGELLSIQISDWPFLILLGLGANLILYCLLQAFSRAQASFLAPIRYLELFLSSLVGFIFFNENLSIYLILGGLVVIGSSFFLNKACST